MKSLDVLRFNRSSDLAKPDALHKPLTKGLMTLDGQSDMQADSLIERMALLRAQAERIAEKRRISLIVYQAEIKFEPIVLGEYFVYGRSDGSTCLSMIAPTEWGRSLRIKLKPLAQVRLQYDHTWEVVNLFEETFLY